LKKFFLFFGLLFFAGSVGATHIVGGEIYYDYQGNNTYLVTLKVYRDCINGQAPFDNPAYVGVYDQNSVLLQTLSLSFPGSQQIPISINNPCYLPPSNVCVEEAIYTGTAVLPPIPGGYFLSYQRCCRNQTILNLSNPLNVGSTYTCHIPDPSVAVGNSSPRFTNLPPLFMCSNVPFIFDHSATDPDGDSLVYHLCDPYDGASSSNPQPNPPSGPPYFPVPWQSPYSTSYPMASSPAMNVDPQTGLLTGTPTQIGNWVFAVCVEEWRNGQLISEDRRDYQFNVMNCPNATVSSFPSQTTFCFGYNVNFLNNSINAMTYHWDFGDASTAADTSDQQFPSWTYSDSGVYNVMLICNPGLPCADTGYTTFYIYPLLNPSFAPPAGQCITGNSFSFTAAGSFMGNGTFSWNFGAGASPQTSVQQNPGSVVYNSTGWHVVTLTVSENNCTNSFTDSVYVYPPPQAHFTNQPQQGCPPLAVTFSDASVIGNATAVYSWDFGDGSYGTGQHPTHTYTQTGTYTVTLILITMNGCVDTVTFAMPNLITVYPVPTALYTADPMVTSIFTPDITFTDLSQDNISCMLYFGDGNYSPNCSTVYTYQNYGIYHTYQEVENSYGCKARYGLDIEIKPEFRFFIPNAFTPTGNGLNDVFMPRIMGVRDYRFMIFDRWGQLFFETDDINTGWDGTYKGRKCQEDVYVWKISCVDLPEEQEHTWVGHVTLIR
jgi:gliding motility-associated-like protein